MEQRRFQIALLIITIETGSRYAAGARIYETTSGSRELVKVASILLQDDTKCSALKQAIKALLYEVPQGSRISISGLYLGTEEDRTLLRTDIACVIHERELTVHMYNNPLKRDRNELYLLGKDAAERGESLFALIN